MSSVAKPSVFTFDPRDLLPSAILEKNLDHVTFLLSNLEASDNLNLTEVKTVVGNILEGLLPLESGDRLLELQILQALMEKGFEPSQELARRAYKLEVAGPLSGLAKGVDATYLSRLGELSGATGLPAFLRDVDSKTLGPDINRYPEGQKWILQMLASNPSDPRTIERLKKIGKENIKQVLESTAREPATRYLAGAALNSLLDAPARETNLYSKLFPARLFSWDSALPALKKLHENIQTEVSAISRADRVAKIAMAFGPPLAGAGGSASSAGSFSDPEAKVTVNPLIRVSAGPGT